MNDQEIKKSIESLRVVINNATDEIRQIQKICPHNITEKKSSLVIIISNMGRI